MEYEPALSRSRVKTPALLLDLDALEHNIATMATRAHTAGVALRPHAKSHKCIEVARLLCRAGALGASCATAEEAESMAAAGIPGVLITSPISTVHALERVHRVLLRGGDLMLLADHPDQVRQYAAMATQLAQPLPVLIELDVGVGRTGCLEIPEALALAKSIAKCPSLRFAGVQAYWGHLQQVQSFTDRRRRVEEQAQRLASLIAALTENDLKPEIVTGGGTGTHWIDGQTGLFTELQPGSYIFLDSCYAPLEMSPEPHPFRPALFVAAGVISANRPDRVIVNAGFKALATDSGKPLPVRGAPANATYRFFGDEHGAIEFTSGSPPPLGSIVELLTSHCDPTVNLHSRYQVVRGEAIVDEWAITARGY